MVNDFNFEYWSKLFKDNPEEFNRQRDALIESEVTRLCDNEDKRKQVIAKVYNVNIRLDRIRNPTERFNRLQVMFWQQFGEFQSSMQDLQLIVIGFEGKVREVEQGKQIAAIHVVAEYGKLIKDK